MEKLKGYLIDPASKAVSKMVFSDNRSIAKALNCDADNLLEVFLDDDDAIICAKTIPQIGGRYDYTIVRDSRMVFGRFIILGHNPATEEWGDANAPILEIAYALQFENGVFDRNLRNSMVRLERTKDAAFGEHLRRFPPLMAGMVGHG